ncbi:hypothetical protein HAV15_008716 [Penicillium sp. str. |nr:hypothetical protein HAV15_008716 [Penicillium sp. str. \
MGCKSSVLVRPQVLPGITVALVWVSQQEIEALVNATETLEITRRGARHEMHYNTNNDRCRNHAAH